MTKTPEQLAEEYRIWILENEHDEVEKPGGHLSIAFLAGYKAAKDEILSKGMQGYITEIRNDAWCTAMQLGQQSQWISVKDRLPDNALEVIAISNGKSTAFLHKLAYCRWIIGETVTHWMPLPKPPEDK